MDIPPLHASGTSSGGNPAPIQPQDTRYQGSSRHPTAEYVIEQAGDPQRRVDQRADGKDSTVAGGSEGPQGLGAVRFQAPQRSSATTTQESPSCACNCHSAGHDHSATSSSPMPPPPAHLRDTVLSVPEQRQEVRDPTRGGEGTPRELVEEKTPRPPQYALPEQGREPKLQRNHSILLKDKDSTSSSQEPLLPRELPPKDHSTFSHVSGGPTRILLDAPLPTLPRDDRNDGAQGLRRARTRDSASPEYNLRPAPSRQHSGIDWIVPVEEDEKVRLLAMAA
jgi:hypothetical protein